MAQDNRPIPAPLPDDYLFSRPRCVRDANPTKVPTHLPAAVQRLLQAMVHGVDVTVREGEVQGPLKPGTPLSSKQAAWAMGFSVDRTQKWMKTRIFKDTLREMIKDRAYSEETENLATAIMIRDDVGGNTPDDRRVRLQAISMIRPKEPASAVNINVQQNNATVNQISPGYVIKLTEPEAK